MSQLDEQQIAIDIMEQQGANLVYPINVYGGSKIVMQIIKFIK